MSSVAENKSDTALCAIKQNIELIFEEIRGYLNSIGIYNDDKIDQLEFEAKELLLTVDINLLPSFHSTIVFVAAIIVNKMHYAEAELLLDFITENYHYDIAMLSSEILFLYNLTGLREQLKLLSKTRK